MRLEMKFKPSRVVHRVNTTEEARAQTMTDLEDADPDETTRRALVSLLPRLRRFCLALTGSPVDADDLCQSTCERAITRLDRWTPGSRLDSWLYRMAQNLHKNAARDRNNRLRILEEHATTDSELVDVGAVSEADAVDVRKHVFDLPQSQREILILICVEGYSYKECADLLDLPSSTVTNRLFQARMRLRELMEAEEDQTGDPKRRASA